MGQETSRRENFKRCNCLLTEKTFSEPFLLCPGLPFFSCFRANPLFRPPTFIESFQLPFSGDSSVIITVDFERLSKKDSKKIVIS